MELLLPLFALLQRQDNVEMSFENAQGWKTPRESGAAAPFLAMLPSRSRNGEVYILLWLAPVEG